MSPRTNHPKKHFVEIFANQKNFELISYARSAFSNGGIVAQLETAIKEKPDLILFNISSITRTEIEIDLGRELTFEEHKKMSDPILIDEVGDINHRPNELSDQYYVNTGKQRIISVNYHSIVIDHPYEQEYFDSEMNKKYIDWDKKSSAIKSQFRYLHNDKWKRQLDCMMMYAILHKLHNSNIPHILVHDYANMKDSGYYPDWFTHKSSIHDLVHEIKLLHLPIHNDPGFHLTYEGSELVAQILSEHYDTYFK